VVDLARRGTRDELAGHAQRMADVIRHRGPDDEGVWTSPTLHTALGHRRLSIIDLSPAGHQPMVSPDNRYALAYNGEVYNFVGLRRELEPWSWRGDSDTEVLLAAIETWGVLGALERINGMFAFALVDEHERRLWLARDRLGEKPLYYTKLGDQFAFASELKSLETHPAWRGEIDREALAGYFRTGYVAAPRTIWEGVRKLAPGTALSLALEPGSRPELIPYWQASDVARKGLASTADVSDAEMLDELDSLISDATRMRMVADVPLGAFLSGGVDSSLIVANMVGASPRRPRTFSIGFREPGFDEAPHAAAVARHLGTDHTELYVTASEALSVIPQLAEPWDEPFADPSQIPTLLLSRLTREYVTVALSGDGGDELFGGYERYLLARRIWRAARWLPGRSRRAAAGMLARSGPGMWDRVLAPPAGDRVLKASSWTTAKTHAELYDRMISYWQREETPVLGVAPRAWADNGLGPDARLLPSMLHADTVAYLPDDILVKVDRASMAASLETRIPLLDHRVVELAWRVPDQMKLRDGRGKWILRKLLDRYVPREIVDRPKQGFAVPIRDWLRDELRPWGEDLLARDALERQGFLDPDAIRQRWDEHQSGRRNWHFQLWTALMFQQWLQSRGRF
jgi:asparagine synthase (glutamine-hydrolysing)